MRQAFKMPLTMTSALLHAPAYRANELRWAPVRPAPLGGCDAHLVLERALKRRPGIDDTVGAEERRGDRCLVENNSCRGLRPRI